MDSVSLSTADTPTDSSGRGTAACWNIIDGAVNMPVQQRKDNQQLTGVNRNVQMKKDLR